MWSTDTAVILDNYAAHKRAKMRRWLTRHPRWTFHFTTTSCSWLNAVETLFAMLTKRRLKRGVFPSVVALRKAINTSSRRTIVTPNRSSGKPIPVSISASAARRTRSE
jgi:transposase